MSTTPPPVDFCFFLPSICALNIFARVLLAWQALVGLVGFFAMGYDKSQATEDAWRVREITLWKIAWIGGAIGVMAGEFAFHHKENKMTFTTMAFAATAVWLFVLIKVAGF